MKHCYKYPRPAVTVDIIIFDKKKESILLIERKNEPFVGQWALPGGFVDKNESLENAARRELKEETALDIKNLEQFRSFGDPGRDPRGHTVSVVFWGVCNEKGNNEKAGDDAAFLQWFGINELPELAFDHELIIDTALSILV